MRREWRLLEPLLVCHCMTCSISYCIYNDCRSCIIIVRLIKPLVIFLANVLRLLQKHSSATPALSLALSLQRISSWVRLLYFLDKNTLANVFGLFRIILNYASINIIINIIIIIIITDTPTFSLQLAYSHTFIHAASQTLSTFLPPLNCPLFISFHHSFNLFFSLLELT